MSTHWRVIEDGTEQGTRVLTKMAEVRGERQLVVLDGAMWRPLRPTEHLRAREPELPQINTDWVA